MQVRNFLPTVLWLPDVAPTPPGNKGFAGVALMPGKTVDVPDEYMSAVQKHATVVSWIDNGYISLGGAARKAPSADAAGPTISNETGNIEGVGALPAPTFDLDTDGDGVPDVVAGSDLAGYTVHDAEAVVREEDDPETLRRWLSTDSRKGVRTAVERRLAEIEQSENES